MTSRWTPFVSSEGSSRRFVGWLESWRDRVARAAASDAPTHVSQKGLPACRRPPRTSIQQQPQPMIVPRPAFDVRRLPLSTFGSWHHLRPEPALVAPLAAWGRLPLNGSAFAARRLPMPISGSRHHSGPEPPLVVPLTAHCSLLAAAQCSPLAARSLPLRLHRV